MPGDMRHTPPKLEYRRDGDVWTMTVYMQDAAKHFSFTIGQPADVLSIDGKPVKVNKVIFNSCNAGNRSFIDGKPVKVNM